MARRGKRGGQRPNDKIYKNNIPAKVFLASLADGFGEAVATCEPSYVDTPYLFTTFPEVMTVRTSAKEERWRGSRYPVKLQLQGDPVKPMKLDEWRSPLVPIENCPRIVGFNQTCCVVASRGSDIEQIKLEDDPRHIDVPPCTEFVGALSGLDIENVTTEGQPQRIALTQSSVFVDSASGSDAEQTQGRAFLRPWASLSTCPSGSDFEDDTAKAPLHPSQRSALLQSKAFSKYYIVASNGSDVEDGTTKAPSHPSLRSTLPQSKASLQYRIFASSDSGAELLATEEGALLGCVVGGSGSDTCVVRKDLSQTSALTSNKFETSFSDIASGSDTEHTTKKVLSRSGAISASAQSDAPRSKKMPLESTLTNDIDSCKLYAMPSSPDKMFCALLQQCSTSYSASKEPDMAPSGCASYDMHINFPIHVCVVQASLGGLSNWPLGNVRTSSKWDFLLDVLLQCLVMDGTWVSCVKASAFVGSDSIHLDHRIQHLAHAHALCSLRRQKQCTMIERTALLWRNFLVDQPGLRWRRCLHCPTNRKCIQQALLKNLRSQFDGKCASAVVLIMDFSSSITYEMLKDIGVGREPVRTSPVYVILPGRYGFDGCHDTMDEFIQELSLCFEEHLMPRCTTRVNITTSCSSHGKWTTQLGAFIRTEISTGALQHVVAGAVYREGQQH